MNKIMGANSPVSRMLPINSLNAYEGSARTHNRTQRRKLESLVRRFGQVVPVIVDQNNTIIDGHAVWEVMRELGYDDISAVIVSGRSDPEIRALRLALNRLPQDAGWDNEMLRKEFQHLLDLSFDMDLTSFSAVEIDHVLEIDAGAGEDGSDIPRPDAVAVSRPADIWVCGPHRIACGDALDVDVVSSVLNGNRPSMAFIDPPYNVPIDGFVSGNGDTRHREFLQGSGEMSEAQFIGFLGQALETLKAVLASGSICFVCIDWRHYYELQCAIRQAALELLNLCVWAKTTPGLGSFYRSQHELVAVLKVGNAEIRNNMALTGKRRNRSNLWTHRGMNSFGDDRDELVRLHPTVKPVALIADAIRDVSMRGEVVLDTFLGSGSTLMAAEETGRVCCGVELDPLYVDVAVRRWEQATRRDATLLESGETFAELSERRAETSPEIAHG
jgi:DNA modification methylase